MKRFLDMEEILRTIGLTGGIGSGKSEVSRILCSMGVNIINADEVSHEAYSPGSSGWRKVVDAFGKDMVRKDGTINRTKLGDLVFADSDKLALLNSIVHPITRMFVCNRIDNARKKQEAVTVLEAAILIEANWDDMVDEVWVVTAPEQVRLNRVNQKTGLDIDSVKIRIFNQISEAERNQNADVLIDNSGSIDNLEVLVKEIWRQEIGIL